MQDRSPATSSTSCRELPGRGKDTLAEDLGHFDDTPPTRHLTLVSSDVAPIGGMERAAFELAARLLHRGWQLTVIARSSALPPHPRLRFVRIPSPSRPVSLALIADLIFGSFALRRHRSGIVQTINPILANRVDLIHAHFCECTFRAMGISRSRRADPAYRLNSWLASWVSILCERWSYRSGRVRSVVCVSSGLAEHVAGCYPQVRGLLSRVPNGVDKQAFVKSPAERARIRAELGVADEELIALFVGGDWHRKGLQHAIEALRHADGWRLLVLGEGNHREFGALAADRGVGPRVLFQGKVPNPIPYYLAADASVAPSYFETFSFAVHEAAAAGLPVIAARVSGVEDLVQDGINGWFTERDGAAIAFRLRALRDDPDLRSSMGRAARASAERYDWERVVDQFEAVYAELGAAAQPH